MRDNIPEFNKNDFDNMLFTDKGKVVELLKNEKMIKIYYSPQKFFYYKIYSKQHDELFLKKENEEKEEIKPIILCDIDFNHKEILRENFRFWYFLGNEVSFYKTKFYGKQTNFSATIFYTERMDFFASEFRSDRTDFSAVEFRNKQTSFSESRFYGRQAYFLGAVFSGSLADFSRVEFYSKQTDFSKAEFKCSRLSFYNSDFMEFVNLDVNFFAEKNIFSNTYFRIGANLDINKFCLKADKLSKPVKLDLGDNNKTKENLHTVKKLMNQLEKFEQADHVLYWYRVYERKSNNILLRKFIIPFEWLFLDKMTGYFTRPERLLLSIFGIILFYFFIYSSAVILNNKTLGTIYINNHSLSGYVYSNEINGFDKIKLIAGNIIYFNIVTYATIGYGDALPTGILKIFAGLEGLIGTILNALFLIVLTKKILR